MESFGARLKRERERQGITLDTVASATKIGTRLLQALEEEKFDRLPGGIFNKGFVRAYARHLGLNEEQAIADYLKAAGAAPAQKEPEALVAAIAARAVETKPGKKIVDSRGLPWGKIAIFLLVLALGLVLWGAHTRNSQKRSHQDSTSQPVPAADSPSPPPPVSKAPESVRSTAQPLAESSAAPIPQTEPVTSVAPTEAAPSPAAEDSFSVLIQAREDCWLSISADGKRIGNELLPAQAQKSIVAHEKVVIRAGNVGGLNFSFNGKPLPVQGGENEVKVLTFSPDGLASSLAKPRQTVAPELEPSQP